MKSKRHSPKGIEDYIAREHDEHKSSTSDDASVGIGCCISLAIGLSLFYFGAKGLINYNNKAYECIYGTVLEESGTIPDRQKGIERSEGDPTYAIKFRTDGGIIYTVQIEGHYNATEERYVHKFEALNLAIDEGTRIRINKLEFDLHRKGSVGSVNDYQIEVLEQK
ncbi:hypothetical protein KAI32_02075 [Candidatus Pacearchaeota archaeon]|nr:hypothetical protein [Candidatus Pacearchaeota archaeon]